MSSKGKNSKKNSGVPSQKTIREAVLEEKKAARAVKDSRTVPESLLKKRRSTEEAKAKRDIRLAELKKKKPQIRKTEFRRAEQYVKEYRDKEHDKIRLKRLAKNSGNFFKPDEAKVVFVVRIRGVNRMSPKTAKILQLLRLRQIHNGVFVKMNAASEQMLRMVEPYVTYGPPSLKSVSDLVYKRGFAKVNKQRVALSDNTIVSNALGQHGVVCVEDIIHEIATCGPHFKEVNGFLWPFKLSAPTGGFKDKRTHAAEGGDAGNREEMINALIQSMN